MPDYLVVGAGISGIVAANLLSQDCNANVELIDRRCTIGGNCYDYYDENGICVHAHGSHIFHTDSDLIWNYLNKYTSFNDYVHRVKCSLPVGLVDLPVDFRGIRRIYSQEKSEEIISRLLMKYDEGSFVPIGVFHNQDDPILSEVYDYLYNTVFFNYTLKQWGRRMDDLDPSIFSRVPVYIGEGHGYFHSKYQGIPSDGYTSLFRRMLNYPNISVHLGIDFKSIPHIEKYDSVFYTGSVDELMNFSLGMLPYRSERFELETIETVNYQDTAVVNYPSLDVAYTRIHEYKHYSDICTSATIIAREYPEPFVYGHNEPYYPIIGRDTAALHESYVELARKFYPNIHCFGRLGDYKYYDMDQAVERAIEIVNPFIE